MATTPPAIPAGAPAKTKRQGLRSTLWLIEPAESKAPERRQHNRAPFHLRDRRRPTWRDVVVCVAFAWGLVLVVRATGLLP